MNNRIKNFYKDNDEESSAPLKDEKGEWVTVHVGYGGNFADDDVDVAGIHVSRGKGTISGLAIERVKNGMYMEVLSYPVMLEDGE